MALPVPGRVAEALRRSTVQVTNGRGHRQGSGSGVVLIGERVITNAHVLRGEPLSVESWEGDRFEAGLLKIDRRRDLALLSVAKLAAPAAALGDSDALRVGTPVLAVGNPLGFVGAVSSGVIHQLGPIQGLGGSRWVCADVQLAPGNSGGPLADFQGRIIGINTMIVAGGMALAIPSHAVQTFLSRTAETRSLGVVVRPIEMGKGAIGLMILELVAGGAAQAGSLLPGDILAGASDARFRSVDDLQDAIEAAPDSLLRLDFYRAGQKTLRHVTVRLQTDQALRAA